MANYLTRSHYTDTGYQDLLQNISTELVRNWGIEGYYLPLLTRPRLESSSQERGAWGGTFGEEDDRVYGIAIPVDFYLVSADSFSGEGQFFSRFGLELRNQVELAVARKNWYTNFTKKSDGSGIIDDRPVESDLIAFPMNNIGTPGEDGKLETGDRMVGASDNFAVFEIKYVEHEQPFYQFGTLVSYQMTADRYEYSSDIFKLSNNAIQTFSSPYYAEGESHTLGTSTEYTLDLNFYNSDPAYHELYRRHMDTLNILGQRSETGESFRSPEGVNTSGTVDFANSNPFVTDPGAMNDVFAEATKAYDEINQKDGIIDLSEKNPFEIF